MGAGMCWLDYLRLLIDLFLLFVVAQGRDCDENTCLGSQRAWWILRPSAIVGVPRRRQFCLEFDIRFPFCTSLVLHRIASVHRSSDPGHAPSAHPGVFVLPAGVWEHNFRVPPVFEWHGRPACKDNGKN